MQHKTNFISEIEKPSHSSMGLEVFEEHKSSLDFSNPSQIRKILMQHFLEGEHETFFEILALYIDYVGKTKISEATEIPERTIYNFIRRAHKTSSENVFKIMKFLSDEAKNA